MGLRQVNNNPDIFGEKKRLVVEFSVESSKALLVKEKRMEKIKSARQAREAGGGVGGKKAGGGGGGKNANAPNQLSVSSEAAPNPHGGFQAEKGKPIQGLPKRLGAKMRHRDRKGKGRGAGAGAGGGKAEEQRKTTATESKKAGSGERRNRKKKMGKGRKGDEKEEKTFQNLVTKYKGGNDSEPKVQKSGKKWDA